MIIVKFENGDIYSIDENTFVIKKEHDKNDKKPDIIITRKITKEMITYSVNNKLKLFECNNTQTECLENLVFRLFPQCKSCKFV